MVSIKAFLLSVTAASFVASPASGMYDRGSVVKQLSVSNFEKVVGKTSQPTFVKFYAPWCGHCKNLEPEYERAAKKARGLAKFYAVNCDEDRNRGLCAQFNVQGFPTLKVFTEKRTKRGTRRSIDYQGERKTSSMVKFARSLLPDLSKRVDADGLDDFIASSSVPKAVLLTERKKPSELWKGVSAQLDRKVRFAQIVNPSAIAMERLGVNSLPAIVVFADAKDPRSFEVYNGENKYEPLVRFISAAASGRSTKGQDTKNATNLAKQEQLTVEEIASQDDLERVCINQSDRSSVPVLCVIGVVPLEPEYEESRLEHAQAIGVLEGLLRGQKPRSANQASAASGGGFDPDIDEENSSNDSLETENASEEALPFRVSWVNALGAAGTRIHEMFGPSDDLPSAVAISPRKSAAAPYRGAFAKEELLEWTEACYEGYNMRRFTFDLDIGKKPASGHNEL
ncbi:hypothetical protein LPJ64_001991 [Coemansia asiatica]|uniref:Thioredoxin domain-containing protein n=1 Tax=Coemansia asiatica TaxID=1052880 RepID=A0A9W7XNZ5_9FUNG|nr:hypothetical protein LPJ64_001991 [Coemansia asiatica]